MPGSGLCRRDARWGTVTPRVHTCGGAAGGGLWRCRHRAHNNGVPAGGRAAGAALSLPQAVLCWARRAAWSQRCGVCCGAAHAAEAAALLRHLHGCHLLAGTCVSVKQLGRE